MAQQPCLLCKNEDQCSDSQSSQKMPVIQLSEEREDPQSKLARGTNLLMNSRFD